MSNNLLGKDENLNAVQPDFVTGGESLSELLSNPNCPLRTLNVTLHSINLFAAILFYKCINLCLSSASLEYDQARRSRGAMQFFAHKLCSYQLRSVLQRSGQCGCWCFRRRSHGKQCQ